MKGEWNHSCQEKESSFQDEGATFSQSSLAGAPRERDVGGEKGGSSAGRGPVGSSLENLGSHRFFKKVLFQAHTKVDNSIVLIYLFPASVVIYILSTMFDLHSPLP